MEHSKIPHMLRLRADVSRVEKLLEVSFGRFLKEEILQEISMSRSRSVLAREMKRFFGDIDWRIRFVEGDASMLPKATMKLFSVDKAIITPAGRRLGRLLDGGVVAAVVIKTALVSGWRIVALKEFLPVGKERERHEADLEVLLRCFLGHPQGKKFPATTIGAFQIRTGPGGFAVYLMAHDYFTSIEHSKR